MDKAGVDNDKYLPNSFSRFKISDFRFRIEVSSYPNLQQESAIYNLQSAIYNLQSAIMLVVPELLPGLRAWPGPGETALIF